MPVEKDSTSLVNIDIFVDREVELVSLHERKSDKPALIFFSGIPSLIEYLQKLYDQANSR